MLESSNFNDHLNRLQQEFERHTSLSPTKSGANRRFSIYLGYVKDEFEHLSSKIESLQKENEEYKAKVEHIQRNAIQCQCHFKESAPMNVISSLTTRPKIQTSSVFAPFSQSRARSSTPGTVDLIPGTGAPREPYPIFHPQDTIIRDSEGISLASSSKLPASTTGGDSDAKNRRWPVTSNREAERGLHVKLAHETFHEMTIVCVKFSLDGRYLAVACYDGLAYFYNVETGTLNGVLGSSPLEKRERIMTLCFSPDGMYLATAKLDGDINIWDINTKFVRTSLRGHTRPVSSLEFSPNGRLLVSASEDNTVRLWNIHDGSARFLVEDSPSLDVPYYSSAVFSADGRYVATSHRDGMVRIWDLHVSRLMRRLRVPHADWQTSIRFMPDGKGLVTGGRDKTLKYWDISTIGRSPTAVPFRDGVEEQTVPEREFLGHKGVVFSLAVSPDGRWVVSGSRDKSVRIWDTRTAAVQRVLEDAAHKDVLSVDFSPAGFYIASGGNDGVVRIWRYSGGS